MAAHSALVEQRLAEGKKDKAWSWYEALSDLTAPAPGGSAGAGLPDGARRGTISSASSRHPSEPPSSSHGPLATYAQGATSPSRLPFSKSVLPLVAAICWAHAGLPRLRSRGRPVPEDRDPKRLAIADFKAHFSKTRVRLVRTHGRWF